MKKPPTSWFTSDLHFDHFKLAQFRGFANTIEHDAVIFDHWEATVGPNDHLWILGDLSIASSKVRVANVLKTIAELPGIKHLIAGNHDPINPMHRDAHKWEELYRSVFASVQAFGRRRIAGESVLMSHYPYGADHTEEIRFQQYRLPDLGERLLHGHTHSSERITSEREIHVGWDAWGRFVNVDELINIVEEN